jgi:hypothetical protein
MKSANQMQKGCKVVVANEWRDEEESCSLS